MFPPKLESTLIPEWPSKAPCEAAGVHIWPQVSTITKCSYSLAVWEISPTDTGETWGLWGVKAIVTYECDKLPLERSWSLHIAQYVQWQEVDIGRDLAVSAWWPFQRSRVKVHAEHTPKCCQRSSGKCVFCLPLGPASTPELYLFTQQEHFWCILSLW